MFSLSNLLNRRPQLSKQEATQVAEAILPVYLARYPGMFPVEYATLLYKDTKKYKNCWVLRWNSKRYAETNDGRDCWIGPGPIFIDRWTGHIRIYPSGHRLHDLLDEYDADTAAVGLVWVLAILFDPTKDLKATARLRSVLGLSLQEISTLEKRDRQPLFAGTRSDLEWFRGKLREAGVACNVCLYGPPAAAELEWVHVTWRQESAAEVLADSRQSLHLHGGDVNFREFDCPLPEIVARYGTPPQRAFQRTEEEEKACEDELFDKAAFAGRATAMQNFLSYRTNVNRRIPGTDGDTALLIAARNGYEEAAQTLLTYGADVTITDKEGRTALELAEVNGFNEIVALLRNH